MIYTYHTSAFTSCLYSMRGNYALAKRDKVAAYFNWRYYRPWPSGLATNPLRYRAAPFSKGELAGALGHNGTYCILLELWYRWESTSPVSKSKGGES